MSSLLIKNGTIVLETGSFEADVYCEDEKVVEVGLNIDREADTVVDATGKYVLPGGVDQHVHMGPFDSMGFDTSNAAIVGGTTTIVDFAPQPPGMGIVDSVKKHNEEEAEGVAMCDYSFHGMVMDPNDQVVEDMKHMGDAGIGTIKYFMAYKGTPFMSEDDTIFKGMLEAKKYGITVMVHAENGDMIDVLQKKAVAEGVTDPEGHLLSRPPVVEDESTRRAIYMAKAADCPLYVVHVSTKGAMREIVDAQARGEYIYGETCSHYLTLDSENLKKPDFEGAKYICFPVLRSKDHVKELWKAVDNGWLNAVSSDTASNIGGFEGAKKKGLGDFTKIPPGAPSVQDRMQIMWTEGVTTGRITKEKFVELLCSQPARNCGFYPQKGTIQPGSDADIAIWDPEYRGTFTVEDSLHGIDYNNWEGWEKKGRPEKVFLRGKLVSEDGKYCGDKGDGKYIKMKPYAFAYDRYLHDKNAEENELRLN